MEVDIVGEDQVTQAVIERLLNDYRPDLIIGRRLPVRGGKIKSEAPKYNLLVMPLILLTDLDTYPCPPSLISDWFNGAKLNDRFLFRVADDEAEAWLMADKSGFAKWAGIKETNLPDPRIIDRRKNIVEMVFPYKSSLFLMKTIEQFSTKETIRDFLTPLPGASKGPGYNSTVIPFIKEKWNVENARLNSYSLNKMVLRLINY